LKVERLIITAALTGGVTIPTQTPYLPLTPEEIVNEAIRAADAGAAAVHIHARDPKDGRPTSDKHVFRKVVAEIKERSDLIIGVTTGGGIGISTNERLKVVPDLKPEIASFNMGSMNFSIHPISERYKDEDYKYPWEKGYLEMTKDAVFKNTFADLELFCQTMKVNGTKPEHEVYDVGHIYNIDYLVRRGLVDFPLWIQFVTGVLGGIYASVEDVMHMKQTAERLFGSQNFRWSVVGAGYPEQFRVATLAIIIEGHVRVGLEDNIYLRRGVLAKSNAELVEKVVRIAREFDRDIATPAEARQVLGLKGKNKVNF